MTEAIIDPVEEAIREYVLTKARLGIYDPLQPRRAQVPVRSFQIEFLEFDEQSSVVHAAGPVVLCPPGGDIEQFLRVSVALDEDGRIPDNADVRAVYIVETDPATGACKETAALANA
jgi:hypothetical protein